MKDLDFDELDRAVASVLSDDTPATPAADAVAASPSTDPAPSTTPSSEAASPSISSHAVHARIMPSSTPARSSTAAPTPAPAESQQPVVTAAPAPKRIIPHREGKFIDVIHPDQAKALAADTSTPAVTSSTPEPTPAPAESQQPVVTAAPAPANPELEHAINELLVSEGHEPTPTTAPASEPVAVEESVATVSADSPAESVDAIAAELAKPLEVAESPAPTPFLPDAKVEKRPLGSADTLVSAEHVPVTPSPAALAASEGTDISTPHTPPPAEIEETPMPEELESNLLAIESGEVSTEIAPSAPAEDAKPEPAAAGPTSIARQYKDTLKKASENDESGAIFDPQTYQQPNEQPTKKKSSGVIWIIAIVVILLIAIVAAVVAWYGGLLPVPL